MGKQARNRAIFAAGLPYGESSGYAVDSSGEPIEQYNGMIGIRDVRTPSEAYDGVLDGNNWKMVEQTGDAGEVLYVLIADETTRAEVGKNTWQNLGRRTADMDIPAELSVRWYRLQTDDSFFIGEENFTAAVGTNEYAIIEGFDLTPQAAAPTDGWYFKIAQEDRYSNIGGRAAGKLYTVDLKKKG